MALAAMLGLVWEGPIALNLITERDFPFHLATAEAFAESWRITVPHFLFQVLLGSLFATGLFSTIGLAGLLFMYVVHAATAAVLCWYIAGASRTAGALVASACLAVAVLMCAPLLPPGVEATVYLIGYFPPNAYHNPTTLLAKPLLVLSFASAVVALTRTSKPTGRELIRAGLPVALMGLAKPNYLGCLVPGVLASAAWNQWKGRAFSWSRVAVVCGAALLTLAAAYVLYRLIDVGYETGIVVSPFGVIALYSATDAATLTGKLLASLAFPLAAVALWPWVIWRHTSMRLAWAAAAIGVSISYLIAESGLRFPDGNFLWTGQMAVFVLFAATAAFARAQLAGERSAASDGRGALLLTVLALHIASGLRHVSLSADLDNWLRWWR